MSQTKVQLLNPLGGNINVAGVVTATTLSVGTSISVGTGGTAGSIGASGFSGDGSGLTGVAGTGSINVATASTFLNNVNISGICTAGISTLNTHGIDCGSGIVTATGFVGNVTGTATGLSGSPSITVTDLTVNGTETIINTDELNVRDKTVGIGSTTTPSSTTQDGSGIIIYGQTNVNILYDNDVCGVGINTGLNVSGFVTATSFSGDGSGLSGVISGLDISADGSLSGTASTALNFAGATITSDNAVGISTITISAGITTTSMTGFGNTTVFIDLSSAQNHDVYLNAGITTFSCTGGAVGESHSIIITQPSSGITTVGFSTYFLWPSGSAPNISQTSASSQIDLISLVVKQVGAAGTQLLASSGLDYQS